MNYDTWMKAVPVAITGDSLWKVEAYRLALFTADVGWHDMTKLFKDTRTRGLADQLFRALGSIGANISEGYSRSSGKDRARFYEYALGSARESRTWYFNGRHVLGEPVANHRMNLLTQMIQLLLAMVPDQRGAFLHEEPVPYGVSMTELESALAGDPSELSELIQNVPFS
jgi:four helix bundle protein